MTTNIETEKKITENVKREEPSNDSKTIKKEKVKAGDNVIEYAETNKVVEEVVRVKKQIPLPSANHIRGFDRFTGKEIAVDLSMITALSRYIYVNNIFDPTPVIEHISYKAIMPGTGDVIMDIEEGVFEDLRHLPKFNRKVHYNYIDGMSKNDPKKNGFYHRTFRVSYPEWITPEDAAAQAKATVSHYGIPDLSGIEKVLWPDFTGKIVKETLEPEGMPTETEAAE